MWKLWIGVFLIFTGIAMPLGIVFVIYHVIDMRKKSTGMKGWTHKSFINDNNLRLKYE
jgi:hypothetical protein